MLRPRIAVSLPVLVLGSLIPVFGQSIISTHSGVVYFFEGSVFIGDQPLQQKFGKFPEIGEGGELRTEHGRAEVLLTPGVMLRVAENSSIRMLSTSLSDTRVELIHGSAILESSEPANDNSVKLVHKTWEVRVPHEGVFRIDSDPPQLSVYKGEADVSAAGAAEVAVKQGQDVPLASVLVPEPAELASSDPFKTWAMSRSQAVSADNATAAGILDDPTQTTDSGFDAAGGFSYFPPSIIPGLSSPYGVSFWSPFQSSLSSMYFPSYLYGYGSLYPAWPGAIRYPLIILPSSIGAPSRIIGPSRGITTPSRTGVTAPGSIIIPRAPTMPPVGIAVPRTVAPRGGAVHAGGRR